MHPEVFEDRQFSTEAIPVIRPSAHIGPSRLLLLAGFGILLTAAHARSSAADPIFATPVHSYPAGSGPASIAIGDFNRDGILDIATGDMNRGSLSVLLGDGSGAFAAPIHALVPNHALSLAAADFNRDGILDLASTGYGSVVASIVRGNGDGSFGSATSHGSAGDHRAIVANDFNSDGAPDLAVVDYYGVVRVMLGRGDGTFAEPTSAVVGYGATSLAVGDLNGDGRQDLIVGNRGIPSVRVLLGRGDGSFDAYREFASPQSTYSVLASDLNRDHRLDVVVANWSFSSLSVFLGKGDGTLDPKTDYACGPWPAAVAVGDLTGDGAPDLVVANELTSGTASVLLGNGNGTFSPAVSYGVGSDPYALALGDLDRDGRLDVVVVNFSSSDVSILLNRYSEQPTSTLVTRFRAVSGPGGLRIEWELSDPGAFEAIDLERGSSSIGEWRPVVARIGTNGSLASVLDDEAPTGVRSWYRLSARRADGSSVVFGPVSAVREGGEGDRLSLRVQTPCVGESFVGFTLPTRGLVRVSLSDLQGRDLAELTSGFREAGQYTAQFVPSDLSPGVYFLTLRAGGQQLTRRIAVIK